MKSKKRLEHIYSVVEFSKTLANIHSLSKEKMTIAALSHDLFRDVKTDKLIKISHIYGITLDQFDKIKPILLHGKIGAEFLRRKYKIDDEIYQAVYYHTSGYEHMKKIGKALVISDSAADGRDYDGLEELRKISFSSLDEGYKLVIKNKINYALLKNRFILEQTVKTWNKMCRVE
ncbi:bis(5'-nucleosyl)-tetraphosphatase (symmetrical) YqeK [Petrotoga sp. 9PW.55.5.1]|uniref:bis(5'-nucleosyl)-tetraphosphatase (symmetrical) YqeK n=1 Tax=Petrotoga sp. 9PW.55.5.1 TaxID=1308979 RepID=UPI0021054C20|nr:bis(5'-nucleosyl)-tetraphosphatase (symmetrical) YqeK [Petrotoga sp. 9PW.55.5.1]